MRYSGRRVTHATLSAPFPRTPALHPNSFVKLNEDQFQKCIAVGPLAVLFERVRMYYYAGLRLLFTAAVRWFLPPRKAYMLFHEAE